MQLFIDSFGGYIHVKNNMFEVTITKDSATLKKLISPQKISSIMLSPGTTITHSVVELAMMNNIDILFLENEGNPIGRVWYSKFGSTSKIRKCQLIASLTELAVRYIKSWIIRKIENQVNFIKSLKKHRSEKSDFFDEKITILESSVHSLNELNSKFIQEISDSLRGYEGTAGRHYFETLSYCLTDDYKFKGRSNRPAKDQFNAFLNYAYGVLYSKVEKCLIIAGLEPCLGFLHRDDYNQKSMVFDFIEPYRIFAEDVVFKLFSGKKVNKSHTDQIVNGFSLNKDGKILLMQSFTKFFDEDKVIYRGKNHTRSNVMLFDAHIFANELIDKKLDIKELERYDLLDNV
jgi:CRISPR-associated protein Cas1